MLVLSRKSHEAVVVAGAEPCQCLVKVTVLEIKRDRVRLGFEAAGEVPVHRWEVWQRICAQESVSAPCRVEPSMAPAKGGPDESPQCANL